MWIEKDKKNISFYFFGKFQCESLIVSTSVFHGFIFHLLKVYLIREKILVFLGSLEITEQSLIIIIKITIVLKMFQWNFLNWNI